MTNRRHSLCVLDSSWKRTPASAGPWTRPNTCEIGPLACDVMKRYAGGEEIEHWVQVKDRIFTADNAADHIDEAY